MALLPAFFHFLTPPGAKAQFLFNHPISCLFLSLLSKRLEHWECSMQIGEEKTWLTVVVFGEACSEALTLFAPCNLRGLNVRVTLQGMSCKTRREDNKRHNKKSSSWASQLLMKNKVLSYRLLVALLLSTKPPLPCTVFENLQFFSDSKSFTK